MGYIDIKLDGERLELEASTRIRFRRRGPLFQRDFLPRSYSFPFNIPSTPLNDRLLDFRGDAQSRAKVFSKQVELFIYGQSRGSGKLVLHSYKNGAYDVHLIIDLGALDDAIDGQTLMDIDYGDAIDLGADQAAVIAYMNAIAATPDEKLVFYPVKNYAFYDRNNDRFGHLRQSTVTMTKIAGGFTDTQWLRIDYYDLENEVSGAITLTAIASFPDPEANEFQAYPGGSLEIWVTGLDESMNAISDFTTLFNASSSYFSVGNQCTLVIRGNDNLDRLRIDQVSTNSAGWLTTYDNAFSEQDILNDYGAYDGSPDTFKYDRLSGSFVTDPDGTPIQAGTFGHFPILPAVYIPFLMERIFKTYGFQISSNWYTDPEIATLNLLTNFALDRLEEVDAGHSLTALINTFRRQFNLSDIMPAIPVKDFLLGVANLFGLVYIYDRTRNRFRLLTLNSIVDDPEYIDLSSYTAQKSFQKQFSYLESIRLDWQREGGDELIKTRMKDIGGANIQAAVNTFADLAAVASPELNELRLVLDEDKYYQYTALGGGTWQYWSDNYYGYDYLGEASEITATADTLHMYRDDYWLVPFALTKGSSEEFELGRNEIQTRLLFYRGIRTDHLGNDYPLASNDIYDWDGNTVGDYKLGWHGEHGLFEKWWKKWAATAVYAEPTTQFLELPVDMLFNLDFSKKHRIHNQGFYFDELEFVIHMTEGLVSQKQTLYRI